MACAFPEPLHCPLQAAAFIVIFKRNPFYPGIAFPIQAQVKFYPNSTEDFFFVNNQADPRLPNTYNLLIHRVRLVVRHILLLLIQFKNSQNKDCFWGCRCIAFRKETFQVFEVIKIKSRLLNQQALSISTKNFFYTTEYASGGLLCYKWANPEKCTKVPFPIVA